MKIKQSIQRKVFVIFGSFTLLLTLIYSSMNIMIAYVVEDEVLEKVLAYESLVIESAFQTKGQIIQPRVDYMKLYLNPENAPTEIAEAYKNKTLTSEVFTENKVHYHIQHLYFDKDNSGLLVAEVTPFLTVSNVSREILTLFLIVFIATLTLSLWLAYRIATKTTKPISTLANEVMLQRSQKDPLIFTAKQTPDEIGYLAHTIDSALNELKQLVKRESDFNRDVSHELRTPLTIINNTLSLADNRPLSRVDIIDLQNSATQMNHIVTTLLTLARSESVELETVQLRSLLEDCVLSLHSKLLDKKFSVNLDVDDNFKPPANKQLLILLVNNLIENAIQYASGDDLLIQLKNNRLYFENRINEKIPKNKINELAEKNIKQPDSIGFGQGLYLVRRIIENLNWNFEINSGPKLFQFVIILN